MSKTKRLSVFKMCYLTYIINVFYTYMKFLKSLHLKNKIKSRIFKFFGNVQPNSDFAYTLPKIKLFAFICYFQSFLHNFNLKVVRHRTISKTTTILNPPQQQILLHVEHFNPKFPYFHKQNIAWPLAIYSCSWNSQKRDVLTRRFAWRRKLAFGRG